LQAKPRIVRGFLRFIRLALVIIASLAAAQGGRLAIFKNLTRAKLVIFNNCRAPGVLIIAND